MKPSLSYHIDLTGVCNLKCPACPMGRDEDYPRHTMTLDEMRAILDKACSESYPLGIWVYNFTEPFIHPKLPEMVRLIKSFGLPCYISSNFNIGKNMAEVIEAGPSVIMCSLSGYSQDVYDIGHRAGSIDKVKANMDLASEAHNRFKSKTKLRVHWHRYKHNECEIETMREWTAQRAAKWDFYSYRAVRMPLEAVRTRFEGGPHEPEEDNLLYSMDYARDACLERKHYKCQLQDGTVSLNSQGFFRMCCSYYENNTGMSFVETPIHTFLKARRESDLCKSCLSKGAHVYGMELYNQPIHSVRVKLEELYRRIPMRGRAVRVVERLRNLKLSARPS